MRDHIFADLYEEAIRNPEGYLNDIMKLAAPPSKSYIIATVKQLKGMYVKILKSKEDITSYKDHLWRSTVNHRLLDEEITKRFILNMGTMFKDLGLKIPGSRGEVEDIYNTFKPDGIIKETTRNLVRDHVRESVGKDIAEINEKYAAYMKTLFITVLGFNQNMLEAYHDVIEALNKGKNKKHEDLSELIQEYFKTTNGKQNYYDAFNIKEDVAKEGGGVVDPVKVLKHENFDGLYNRIAADMPFVYNETNFTRKRFEERVEIFQKEEKGKIALAGYIAFKLGRNFTAALLQKNASLKFSILHNALADVFATRKTASAQNLSKVFRKLASKDIVAAVMQD